MRGAVIILVATSLLGARADIAAAQDEISRAGPVEVRPNACLTAKLNPRLGPPCETPAIPQGASSSQLAAVHLKRAHHFIDLSEFQQARREIDAGLEADVENFELRLLSARLAMSAADTRTVDPTIAARDIKIALRLKPLNPDAGATYAEFLYGTASADEAFRTLNAILRRNPAHDYSRISRAKMFQAAGRHREALNDLDVVVVRQARLSNHLVMRARSHLALGQAKDAIADLTDALALAPNDMTALTERAAAHEMAGDDASALADFDALLGPVGAAPNYAVGGDPLGKSRLRRAFLLVRLKRFQDAAIDVASSLLTGKASVLRAQVFLRQNGFPAVPVSGQDSPELRSALQACFELQSCFQGIMRAI